MCLRPGAAWDLALKCRREEGRRVSRLPYVYKEEIKFPPILCELDQNRTDIYFRDREVLYLFKLLILGDKRFELLKAIAIEFTAQPFLPIKEPSFI